MLTPSIFMQLMRAIPGSAAGSATVRGEGAARALPVNPVSDAYAEAGRLLLRNQ